jgi:tetratricopeptide (TPR) repeat protein
VWALGILLYEMVAGRRPFEGATTFEAHERITRDEPPHLAGPLGAVARRALQKDPARRYPSAGAFADDLARAARGEPVRGPRGSLWPRGRGPLLIAGAALAVIAGATAAIQISRARRQAGASRPNDRTTALFRQEEDLTRTLWKHPNDAASLMARARIRHTLSGQTEGAHEDPAYYGAALEDVSQVLRLHPNDPEALYLRGRILTERGRNYMARDIDPTEDLAAAEVDATRANALDMPLARLLLGKIRYARGVWRSSKGQDGRPDWQAAEAALTPPLEPYWLGWRGLSRAALARFDDADQDFAAALSANPNDMFAWEWRGMARAQAGDLVAAEAYLDKAIEVGMVGPMRPIMPYVIRGDIRARRGRLADALADWKHAQTLVGYYPDDNLRARIKDAEQKLRAAGADTTP